MPAGVRSGSRTLLACSSEQEQDQDAERKDRQVDDVVAQAVRHPGRQGVDPRLGREACLDQGNHAHEYQCGKENGFEHAGQLLNGICAHTKKKCRQGLPWRHFAVLLGADQRDLGIEQPHRVGLALDLIAVLGNLVGGHDAAFIGQCNESIVRDALRALADEEDDAVVAHLLDGDTRLILGELAGNDSRVQLG
jgi:hypothetical protein